MKKNKDDNILCEANKMDGHTDKVSYGENV